MKKLSVLLLAICIALSSYFCAGAAENKLSAKNYTAVTNAKTDYNCLVKQFNKESAAYNPNLKKVRNLIMKAGNLETYLETVDFPHERKAVTIKTDVGNIKAYKTTSKCQFKSLNTFYKALSQYWSESMVKKLKDYCKGRYYEYKGAVYVDSNICDDSINMPVSACTVKLIKKYGDGSAKYTVRLARSSNYFYAASKTDVIVKNYSGKLKLNTMLGGTAKKVGGNCETYIVDKSGFCDVTTGKSRGFGKCFNEALVAAFKGGSGKAREKFYFWTNDNPTVNDYIKRMKKDYINYKLISCTESDLNCLADNANYEIVTNSRIQLTDKKGKKTVKKVKTVMTVTENQELHIINIKISCSNSN